MSKNGQICASVTYLRLSWTSNQEVGGSTPSGGAYSIKYPPKIVKISRKRADFNVRMV